MLLSLCWLPFTGLAIVTGNKRIELNWIFCVDCESDKKKKLNIGRKVSLATIWASANLHEWALDEKNLHFQIRVHSINISINRKMTLHVQCLVIFPDHQTFDRGKIWWENELPYPGSTYSLLSKIFIPSPICPYTQQAIIQSITLQMGNTLDYCTFLLNPKLKSKKIK